MSHLFYPSPLKKPPLPAAADKEPWLRLVSGPWHATLMQQTLGEFVATLIFMLGANGSIAATGNALLPVALGTAFATYAVTAVFASVGVLTAFNWGITLVHYVFYTWVAGGRRWTYNAGAFVLHCAAQFLGALASIGLLRTFYSATDVRQVLPPVAPGLTDTEAFWSEAVLSAVVYTMFVWSGAVQLRRRATPLAPLVTHDRALVFALLVAAAIFVGANGTGTYINPARYLAAAAVEGRAPHAVVFVVGPLVGAVVATAVVVLLYELFRQR